METKATRKEIMVVKNNILTHVLSRIFMLEFFMCGSRGLKEVMYFSTKPPNRSREIFL